MALTHDQMHHLAHDLMDALEGGGAIEPLTEQAPGITEHDAREIAFDILGHRHGPRPPHRGQEGGSHEPSHAAVARASTLRSSG